MDGDIIAFDDDAQEGIVTTRSGQRYPFGLKDWRGRGLPATGIAVRFDVHETRAVHVFNQPEAQRRAIRRVSGNDATQVATRRYSQWAIAAIVMAMLSLFFDIFAPLLELVAAIFALLGLRRIRREPERYRGRGFCWVAIALALLVATLSLLIEPAPESRISQSHHHVMPGSDSYRAIS